ncbi:MAG: cation transporter [Gemmatimonadaceae bacterium]|nr:cation transporter [Gemmatimonadaceae bacterium]NUR20048.1 cation transporter [Gemmatimonadaceae bacterium]NUS96980.1 cation transporter [Gemmatimonadaceae bacterium]
MSPITSTNPETDQRSARAPAVRATLLAILVANALVVAVKLAIGIRTGTLTVLGAALESGLDMLNNVMGILLINLAARAPDEDHPYGHDKFETLGAIGIVGFLSITCFELLREGVHTLLSGRTPHPASTWEIAVLAGTLLVNVFVVWYERRRGRELHSAFLLADASHTVSDVYVTGLALVSLLVARVGFPALDAVLAIVVALIIAWTGYGILKETVPILVDQRGADPEEIRASIAAIEGVHDVRAIRSRLTASGTLFAEVTIGVGEDMSVADAHRLADEVEEAIAYRYGLAEVTVHVEPA